MGCRTIKVIWGGMSVKKAQKTDITLKSYAEILQDMVKQLKGTNAWYDLEAGSALNTLLEVQSGQKKVG